MCFSMVAVIGALLGASSLVSAGIAVARSEGIVYTVFHVPTPTNAPGLAMAVQAKPDYNGQPLTIHIENKAGNGLYMNLKHDVFSPPAICYPHNGHLPASTQVTYPTNWAEQIAVGPVPDDGIISRGSKIEASFQDGIPYVDVSYVDGYTYPIVCTCQGQIVGCNYPLLAHAAADGGCPSPGNKICYNPDVHSGKAQGLPALPFFEPCQGAALTYPNDFAGQTQCPVNEIFCCVGALCPRNPRQHKRKRDLDFAIYNGTLPADVA